MSSYAELGMQIGGIVQRKNIAYGSSFARSGDFLRLLFPDGVPPERYVDALLLVRIFDKCMRIATDRDPFGESPYEDIAGYGLLGAKRKKESGASCPGSASDPTASESSKAQPDSATLNTSAKTTTSASARRDPRPSPKLDASSPPSRAASAPTAPATASADADDRVPADSEPKHYARSHKR